ncbi:MAG: GntR family transcriptional regulator [Nocardioidaceae bacterium]
MPSLSVQSLADALTDSLRSRIMAGELHAGDALTEAGLASHYEVARPTAKAAIERLVAEGLLERSAHKRARVPTMDLSRIADMYFARELVECQAYRLLAGRRALPDEAVRANDDLRSAAESGALPDLVDADVRFHQMLVHALESPRISKIHGALINEMRLCLVQVQAHRLLDPGIIADEHASILQAIGDGDSETAAERGTAHLNHAKAKLTEYLTV